MRAEWARSTVGNYMGAQFTSRALDRDVDLTRRNPEALGHQLEVMDQRLHGFAHDVLEVIVGIAHAVRTDRQLRRPCDLLVADHDWRAPHLLQPLDTLLDDLEAFPHLVEPDSEPPVRVHGVPGLH